MGNYERLKHIIKEFLDEQHTKQKMHESGYATTARTMRGLRKNIKTIAILSAENPFGEDNDPNDNRNRTSKLKRFLHMGGYGYTPVKGSYGAKENSFIINNISKGEAMFIGEKFEQDSIIYGEVMDADTDNVHMVFSLIITNPKKPNKGETDREVKVFIDRNDATDFYSEIKGRKFILPFYDVIEYLVDPNSKSYEITKSYDDTEWSGGVARPSKITTRELSKDDQELEEELNRLQENVLTTIGSTSYNYRGKIRNLLVKNNLL